MARKSNVKKAGENYQLWNRANTSSRNKWQVVAQKGHDFYLNEHYLIPYDCEYRARCEDKYAIYRAHETIKSFEYPTDFKWPPALKFTLLTSLGLTIVSFVVMRVNSITAKNGGKAKLSKRDANNYMFRLMLSNWTIMIELVTMPLVFLLQSLSWNGGFRWNVFF